MRAHRTKTRCLKRFAVFIIAVALLPISIVYFSISDQIYDHVKRIEVSYLINFDTTHFKFLYELGAIGISIFFSESVTKIEKRR